MSGGRVSYHLSPTRLTSMSFQVSTFANEGHLSLRVAKAGPPSVSSSSASVACHQNAFKSRQAVAVDSARSSAGFFPGLLQAGAAAPHCYCILTPCRYLFFFF